MQPFSRTNAASPATTHPLAAEANAADRELLIDIDFFDTQGRWNPRHVVFCTAEDGARAKSLWTRCFRGLMALHGKLWAKNYLDSHFSDRAESKYLIQQIKKTGFVDKKCFQSMVAHCTLLYENLKASGSKKGIDQHRIMPASPIEDIDQIVAQHFVQIDWDQWKQEEHHFTFAMARNVQKIFGDLKPSPANDRVAKNFLKCVAYREEAIANKKQQRDRQEKPVDDFLARHEASMDEKRIDILALMSEAVERYFDRVQEEKIMNEAIAADQTLKKE
jgi:hypothetical protein